MPRKKLDKILDNTYYESYCTDNQYIDFHSEEFAQEDNYVETAFSLEIMEEIDNIIVVIFPDLKKKKRNNVKRINKDVINAIYSHVKHKISIKYKIVDVWYYLSEYLDVDTNKFYESLKDEYKLELLLFLQQNTNLLDSKNIDKMF